MLELKVMVAAAAALAASAALAQQYRWRDENGATHYSDTRPPAAARDVRSLGGANAEPAAEAAPDEKPEVTLYTAPNCAAACRNSRQLLDARGVPYREFSAFDESSLAALKQATGEGKVPALKVGDKALVGFSAAAWNSALDAAGYSGTASDPTSIRPPLTLYTNSKCGELCASARSYLEERSLEFSEVTVEARADVDKLRKLTGHQNVPVLTVGNLVQRGFDPELYARALEAMGYPGVEK